MAALKMGLPLSERMPAPRSSSGTEVP
jgi:hypothetical protein